MYYAAVRTGRLQQGRLAQTDRVRVNQQVLFLSCVLGALGKSLDKKYMTKLKEEEKWSTLRFPKKKPLNQDF